MNKRLFAFAAVTLCAVVVYAGVGKVKSRSSQKPVPKVGVHNLKTPKSGEVQVVSAGAVDAKGQDQDAVKPPSNNVPEYVVYGHLFRYHNFLMQKAEEAERRGEDASFFRNFYQREASLDDRQATMLSEIAAQCELDLKAVDAEAKVIIDQVRARYASSQVKPDEPVPPPPPELLALQERRNNLILQARDQLHKALGESAFNDFQTYVREKVASQIKPKSLDTLRSIGRDSSQRQPQVNPLQDK